MAVNEESLVKAMREYFGKDERRIKHAISVLGFAKQIILLHEEADENIVVASAVLHDIGIREAERKYSSSAARYQELEGPPVARQILESLGAGEELIVEVEEIVGRHHSPKDIETIEFSILYDSDWIVNLGVDYDLGDRDRIERIIETVFLTGEGGKIARQEYLR